MGNFHFQNNFPYNLKMTRLRLNLKLILIFVVINLKSIRKIKKVFSLSLETNKDLSCVEHEMHFADDYFYKNTKKKKNGK